jgi:hypothetical protein
MNNILKMGWILPLLLLAPDAFSKNSDADPKPPTTNVPPNHDSGHGKNHKKGYVMDGICENGKNVSYKPPQKMKMKMSCAEKLEKIEKKCGKNNDLQTINGQSTNDWLAGCNTWRAKMKAKRADGAGKNHKGHMDKEHDHSMNKNPQDSMDKKQGGDINNPPMPPAS